MALPFSHRPFRLVSCTLRAARAGRLARPRARCYSSASASASASGPVLSAPQLAIAPLAAITAEFDKLAPRFDISPSSVTVIRSPEQFYDTLKSRIGSAKRRIFLSTLYIGKSEHELVSCLREALRRNRDLKVSILIDSLRGTRETPNPSSASLLVPLVAEFGDERVEVRLFHTPNLTGLRKKWVPKRINEGWGLQHMKLYGIDDDIILSGANLSSDYFTNRQDRYYLISSAQVTDYYAKVHDSVSQLSFKVNPRPETEAGFLSVWEKGNPAPSPLDDPDGFVAASSSFLAPLTRPQSPAKPASRSPPESFSSGISGSTTLYPLLQLTPLMGSNDTSNELPAMHSLFSLLSDPAFRPHSWLFTAGYFNITPEFRQLLLDTRPENGTVIAASPWANGFFGSSGVSGMLPAAYTLLARRFVEAVDRLGLQRSVELKEWRRGTVNQPGGWTYHAKGFWLTLGEKAAAGSMPCLTVIGSSNYTKRSHTLDLEANAVIVTADPELQRRMADEVAGLSEFASKVDITEFQRTERRVSLHVRVAMWIVTFLGGAL